MVQFLMVVKGIFVICDWSFFYPVKCEMAIVFLVSHNISIVAVKRDFATLFSRK